MVSGYISLDLQSLFAAIALTRDSRASPGRRPTSPSRSPETSMSGLRTQVRRVPSRRAEPQLSDLGSRLSRDTGCSHARHPRPVAALRSSTALAPIRCGRPTGLQAVDVSREMSPVLTLPGRTRDQARQQGDHGAGGLAHNLVDQVERVPPPPRPRSSPATPPRAPTGLMKSPRCSTAATTPPGAPVKA